MKPASVLVLAVVACTAPEVVATSLEPPTVATTTTVASTSTTTAAITTTTTLPPLRSLGLELLGEDFVQPTFVTSPPGDRRLFVVERVGRVTVLGSGGRATYLDITDRVSSGGIEQGMLGLAFHPDFAANGRLFAYYVDHEANSRLVELAGGPEAADPSSETLLIAFDQFVERHYGGMLLFGPDGYLWSSHGEGGKASLHAQNPDSLLGAILRIDVDGGDPYGLPPDNPYSGGGGAPEVWAKGLRNPWRFSIDAVAGEVYVADVGHSEWEEINVVGIDAGGANFGWLPMEGGRCFEGRSCDPEGKVLPVVEYPHAEGCSVTGGLVYRGAAIPELIGHYFYSDWCSGWLRSFRYEDGTATDLTEWDVGPFGQPNSFGLDPDGELLIVTHEGRLLRIVPQR